jgi:hypothetical protein
MEAHLGSRTTIGEEGIGLEQQHHLRPLAQVIGDRPLPHEALRVLDKGGGKQGTIQWQRPRHGITLFLFTTLRLLGDSWSLPPIPAQPYN